MNIFSFYLEFTNHFNRNEVLKIFAAFSSLCVFFTSTFQDWEGRVSIGKFYDTSETGSYIEGRAFQGILDELFIYNRALSQIEVSRLSQICDFRRIVLYYGFEKIHGDLVYDQSGLANYGLIVNSSQITQGQCDKALNLSSTSYIALHGDQFRQKPANAISISVWIRLNTNRLVWS